MLERFNPVLRIVCLALAGLVLFQISRIVTRKDPLANLNLAALSLPAASTIGSRAWICAWGLIYTRASSTTRHF